MKYCIFGGSFDPPHEGHRHLARAAVDALQLDNVFWVPAPDPPHKTRPGTSFEHRVAMVKLFIRDTPRQTCSDIEATLSRPSYSLNTLRALKAEYGPTHDWHFLIGADNWSIFPTWHKWEDILKEATLVIYPRQGHPVGPLPTGVLRLDFPEKSVQSRRIREALAAMGNMDSAQVPVEIREYILRNHLYGLSA